MAICIIGRIDRIAKVKGVCCICADGRQYIQLALEVCVLADLLSEVCLLHRDIILSGILEAFLQCPLCFLGLGLDGYGQAANNKEEDE